MPKGTTRKELTEAIHTKIGFSTRDSAQVVDYFFEIIEEKLIGGERVKIPNFGSFWVQRRKSKKGRNPHTGKIVEIPERNAIVFKPSKSLRNALNKKLHLEGLHMK